MWCFPSPQSMCLGNNSNAVATHLNSLRLCASAASRTCDIESPAVVVKHLSFREQQMRGRGVLFSAEERERVVFDYCRDACDAALVCTSLAGWLCCSEGRVASSRLRPRGDLQRRVGCRPIRLSALRRPRSKFRLDVGLKIDELTLSKALSFRNNVCGHGDWQAKANGCPKECAVQEGSHAGSGEGVL